MRIVFAGTPGFAVPSLRAIRRLYGDSLVAAVTQPDKPQGRKGILTPPPVKAEAEALGVPVLQFPRIRDCAAELSELRADLMVTCAYGQILTQEILDRFPLGVWNIHASLLPAYRGAAPIARAIIDGERETGVTIMKTGLGLDTGDILLSEKVKIEDSDTFGTLSARLADCGSLLITHALDLIGQGKAVLKQQGEGSVCKKVARTEVDFGGTAREVSCLIRGLSPAPLAFARVSGLTLNLLFAEEVPCEADVPAGTVVAASPKQGFVVRCGSGAVRIRELQPAGGKVMDDRAFCNGRKLEGARFEQPVS